MNNIRLKTERLEKLFLDILHHNNVREDVAIHLVNGIIQASLRGIDSHGIRLFPHYLTALNKGRLNKNPDYLFNQKSPGTGLFDADHAPGHAAGMEGMIKAIDLAKTAGIGAVAVSNSSHFGFAAYFALKAAEKNMIGLSFTQATAHVVPYYGVRPFLGNNPFCLVAPCAGEEPFCLDMATSTATFNKVQTYAEKQENMPNGWALDKNGDKTNDPSKVFSLLPVGNYKGFGLSMALEILCSLLTGMEYGPNVTEMFDNSMSKKRKLGHYFIAINIANFVDPKLFKIRMKEMMNDLRMEPNNGLGIVQAPGDPEKNELDKRNQFGIPIDNAFINRLENL